MKSGIESALRLVNVTSSGLLAGSLGFTGSVLMPGAEDERSQQTSFVARRQEREWTGYFNAIGPLALATSAVLALGSRDRSRTGQILDAISAVGLAGVLATTQLVTVPINKRLDSERPADYPSEESWSRTQNFHRAHAVRRVLGIGAFVCAAASSALRRR